MPAILPNDLIANGLIPEETVVMLLMLPVIATIQGFARHIIGIRSLGLYAPIILTYAFFQLSIDPRVEETWTTQFSNGLVYGLIMTIVVFVTSYLFHLVTKKLRLHYFPKVAVVLSAVALSVYVVLVFANWNESNQFLSNSILPVILIATVSEQFVSIMSKKDFKTAFSLATTTVLLTIAAFALMIIEPFQQLLLDYPYLLIITLILNIIIGKFTGLRLFEYYRFKEILDKE